MVVATGDIRATYNVQNQLTSWNGTAIGYDLDANMTSNGANTLSWDARGQLNSTNQGSVGYGYDGLGRRISRSVSGATQSKYLFDGLQMVQEQSGTGTVTANTLTGQGIDQPLRRSETSGTTRNYLTDGLGSVIGLADGQSTPTVPTSYTYEAYGTQTLTGAASTNPFGFTAREFDSANGLQFNRARSMSPTFGRFISEDPIDIAGGLNLYGYAGNAPTMFSDPLGLEPGECTPALLGCIDLGEFLTLFADALAIGLSLAAVAALAINPGVALPLLVYSTAVGMTTYFINQGAALQQGGGSLTDAGVGAFTLTIGYGTSSASYFLAPVADISQFLWDWDHAVRD